MGRFREEKIIKTQEEANQTSSLYVLPVDEETFRLIITDDLGEKKISTVLPGNTKFIQLSDAPLSYINNAGKVVVVNPDEDGLIFTDAPPGQQGEAATIEVGTVETVTPNEPVVVVNTGTPNEAIFDFKIPRGQEGESATIEVGTVTSVVSSEPPKVINVGSDKDAIFNFEIPVGADGESATLNVGTVTTVDSNDPATITNTGTASNAVFNFEIPKGEKGDEGEFILEYNDAIETVASDITTRADVDSGVMINYRETTTWYDGTPINDSLIDNDIFIKTGNIYKRKTIDPNTLLKVNTIADLRNTNGYYEGQEISLLGYYVSGDKEPLNYKFTINNFNANVDDGGSIIKSSKGSWIAQFYENTINPEDFGCANLDSDTFCWMNLVQFVNDNEWGRININIAKDYNIGTIMTSNFRGTKPWVLVAKYRPQCQILFINKENISVYGGGCIKVKDSSTPTYANNAQSFTILSFMNSNNINVSDITIDGNRINQLHTLNTNLGHNHGIFIDRTCRDVHIRFNDLKNFGSLRTEVDKRGDAIFLDNGIINLYIENNTFTNVGRWAVSMQSGETPANNININYNTYNGAIRGVPPVNPNDYCEDALGFVDIETYVDVYNVNINNNIINNSGAISVSGGRKGFAEVLCENFKINNNTWNSEQIGGSGGYDRCLAIGNTNVSLRKYKNLEFCNNTIRFGNSVRPAFNRILSVETCFVENIKIDNNIINMFSVVSGSDTAGLNFYRVKLFGNIYYSNNKIKNTTNLQSWFGVRSEWEEYDSTPSNFNLYIINNIVDGGHRGVVLNVKPNSIGNIYVLDNILKTTLDNGSNLNNGLVGAMNLYYRPFGFVKSATVANVTSADLTTISISDLTTISTVDATDATTTQALVNELKAKLNLSILLLNDNKSKYNTSVPLVNSNKAQLNAKLLADKNSGQQAP